MSRLGLILFLSGLLAGACAEPTQIDVRLVLPPTLSARGDFEDLSIVFLDPATGTQIQKGTVSELDESTSSSEVLEASRLREDSTYVVSVEAASSKCANGRAVGRSSPFVHRTGDYAIPVQVGCADEFVPTRGRPSTRRILNALVTTTDGEALVAGGARSVSVVSDVLVVSDPVELTERYDPQTGRFIPGASLQEPHSFSAALALEGGAVALFGGIRSRTDMGCESSVEIVRGLTLEVAAPLSEARCAPVAALLPTTKQVLVMGSALGPSALSRNRDGEAYDEAVRFHSAEEIRGQVYRFGGTLVALSDGRSALMVGGVLSVAPEPIAEIVRAGSGCGQSFCTEAVAMDDAPTKGFVEGTATWVPCARGGGSVYIVGGRTGASADSQTLAGIWCFRDVPGSKIVRAGSLPAPRARHAAALVRGEPARLLVIGGTPDVTSFEVHSNALLVPVDGCQCSPIESSSVRTIPLPIEGLPLLLTSTVLDDGSILTLGGANLRSLAEGMLGLEATGEALLFVPDL